MFNRASARKRSPKFPIPITQILASALSVEHASGVANFAERSRAPALLNTPRGAQTLKTLMKEIEY